ncbi:xanthan lyase [Bacteroides sp. 519]|uniref:golvesin C-terminal-like domain-containing protein n=1 Tax=Bacteroides sp. 519 TaxID=2302937 RepID=UPI0013D75824|nr:xanthan lyase [Bacteroides sp. 519]NDV56909.1 xanthan lyase [Bacteroides sp. 519]
MKKYCISFLFLLGSLFVHGQVLEQTVEVRLQEFFETYTPFQANIGKCKLNKVEVQHNKRRLIIHANDNFGYQPFLPETIENIYQRIAQVLPGPVNYYDITIYVNGVSIEELIPNLYRKKKKNKTRLSNVIYKDNPWVENASRPYKIPAGLHNNHLSLWQSHGYYFDKKENKWKWQRPPLFCTREDIFTQSFVVPYLIPMLENAGAVVFTPRERDIQRNEVIVNRDRNSNGSVYLDKNSKKGKWTTSHNNVRHVQTEKKSHKAFAEWVPNIPETGEYAVYVSYQTLPNSVSDANYIVYHQGGSTEFLVNQQIGGGTWVYLGTFLFEKGRSSDHGMVILSNKSKEKGIISANAVRFGGGIGKSGLPRYLEAARYSAQWAGMPTSVYACRDDDYSDDIVVRGTMTNYLSGGSVYNPSESGLGVPFVMSMGIHSDAGYSKTDNIIGTLGIYTTGFNNGKLNSGISRYASRDLADIVMTDIQRDIRTLFTPNWQRRSMWDKNYGETRIPGVPSMILEMLSHQNFADMRLGHDPNFKFAMSRSVYKSILRFVSSQHDNNYVVQPLPVTHFAIQPGKKNTVELTWREQEDPLEPTAKAQRYMVYTRLEDGGFDNGVLVKGTSHTVKIEPGLIYSFKVSAINKGGESFPSEILSAYISPINKSSVLIVNGFDRLSGPAVINTPELAGFNLESDPGVPYQYTTSLSGIQTGFERKYGGIETEKGWGYSKDELIGVKIAGNTFDYPFVHGKAIRRAGGYSFVSCSDEAVESGIVRLTDYPVVDYILGLEKASPDNNYYSKSYKTFTPVMQQLIRQYCTSGGNILVSGSYIGSDMLSPTELQFTREVLKYEPAGTLQNPFSGEIFGANKYFTIPRKVNETTYAVPQPDCIAPVGGAYAAFAYTSGMESAGIIYKGKNYKTFVLGFPFESILSEEDRTHLMKGILYLFNVK